MRENMPNSLYYPIYWVCLILILISEYLVSFPGKYETSSYVHNIRFDSVKFLMTMSVGVALPSILREFTAGSWDDIFVERSLALFVGGPMNVLVLGSMDRVGQSVPLFWVLIGKIQYISLFVLTSKRVSNLQEYDFGLISFFVILASDILSGFSAVPCDLLKSLRIFAAAVEGVNMTYAAYTIVHRASIKSRAWLGFSPAKVQPALLGILGHAHGIWKTLWHLETVDVRTLRLLSCKAVIILATLYSCIIFNVCRWEDYSEMTLVCLHLAYLYNLIVITLNVVQMSEDSQWRLRTNLEIKKNVIRHLSHQVRNPLNVIVGGLDVLKAELDDVLHLPENEELLHLMGELGLACGVAVNVMDDLVYFEDERVVADSMGLRVPVSANLLVDSAIGSVKALAREKGVIINMMRCAEKAFVLVDSRMMLQALRNLIADSIKLSNPNGVVVVGLVVEGQCVVLRIIDFGLSVDAEKLAEVAQVLGRADRTGVMAHADHVNLEVARSIIARHSGEVSFDSNGGNAGAMITVALPLVSGVPEMTVAPESVPGAVSESTPAPAPAPSEGGPSSRNGAKIDSSVERSKPVFSIEVNSSQRILVVDDVASCRKVVTRMLTRRGHVCTEADDGTSCVAIMGCDPGHGGDVNECPFDAILLDNTMTEMNGPAACKRLRAAGYTLPIIGLTGNMLPEDVEEFMHKGADAVLSKPATYEQIIGAIHEALKRGEKQYLISPMASEDTRSQFTEQSIDADLFHSLHVLIVDEVKSSRNVTKLLLTRLGHLCGEAADVKECLELIGKDSANPRFDVIIMDNVLPILNGLSVVDILRQKGFQIPIISIANAITVESTHDFLTTGVSKVLTKPVPPNDLAEALIMIPSLSRSRSPAGSPRTGARTDVGKRLLRPLRVLVVDDSFTARKLVRTALVRHGHVCVEAEDGDTCLRMLENPVLGGFDVVILDNAMDRVDGPSCVSLIREKKLACSVIGLTAHFSDEERNHFLSSGADLVLQKTASLEELTEALYATVMSSCPLLFTSDGSHSCLPSNCT